MLLYQPIRIHVCLGPYDVVLINASADHIWSYTVVVSLEVLETCVDVVEPASVVVDSGVDGILVVVVLVVGNSELVVAEVTVDDDSVSVLDGALVTDEISGVVVVGDSIVVTNSLLVVVCISVVLVIGSVDVVVDAVVVGDSDAVVVGDSDVVVVVSVVVLTVDVVALAVLSTVVVLSVELVGEIVVDVVVVVVAVAVVDEEAVVELVYDIGADVALDTMLLGLCGGFVLDFKSGPVVGILIVSCLLQPDITSSIPLQ